MVDSGDGPGVAVAHGLTGGGREATVVAAGGDHIAEVGCFAGGDPCRKLGVEVTGGEAGRLDGVVDGVDVVVGRRHQGDGAAVLMVVDPRGGDAVEVLLERAGNDAVVRLVGVQARVDHRIAVAGTRLLPSGG